jgi:hypothetical protein
MDIDDDQTITFETAKAVQWIRQGRVSEGLQAYRSLLHRSTHRLPCGLHVRMLEQAGSPASEQLLTLTLEMGGNLCIGAMRRGAAPEAVLSEYLSLFAKGLINSTMIGEYLILAGQLGRHDEVAMLTSPIRVFRTLQLTLDDPLCPGSSRLPQIERALLSAKDRTAWQEERQSVRKMHYLSKPQAIEDAALQHLLTEIRRAVDCYIRDLEPTDHPVTQWIPRSFTMEFWAVISHGDGYNIPHRHPRGWLSGAFYIVGPSGPAEDKGGLLRVGRPPTVPADEPGWPDLSVTPAPGTLVLMPSYLTHWTIPLERPGLRLALAFDVIDSRQAPGSEI